MNGEVTKSELTKLYHKEESQTRLEYIKNDTVQTNKSALLFTYGDSHETSIL